MPLRHTPSAAVIGLAALALLTGCTGSPSARSAVPTVPAASTQPPIEGAVVTAVTAVTAVKAVKAVILKAAPARPASGKAHRLAGLTIVLDPGHNGGNSANPARLNAPVPAGGFSKPCNTAGASTNGGYPEHAYNWDVVSRATVLLRAEGATVVLTRPSDTGFGPCVNVRAAIGNAAQADAVVAVHADGASSGSYGFHVIAPALAPDGGNAKILARSWALALAVHTAFHDATGEPFSSYVHGGLTKRSDLAGLNLSRVPAIFIECANMRNATDASHLTSPAWRQRAASGIVAGITAFLHR
jgi:N-acetylmuramoyl-L-alanine amidase